MKGIILAGGVGSRLRPLTSAISKQLLPIYDKPMIYYPLSIMLLADIIDVLIITTVTDNEIYKKLLGDGSKFGMRLSYVTQDCPRGLPDAFIVGEQFIGNDNVCMMLGDNIIYGDDFVNKTLIPTLSLTNHASIFAYHVSDPERYGVIEFDKDFNIISIEEKPLYPKSNYAITGLYVFTNDVIKHAKTLMPSSRGELEIVDLIRKYHELNCLNISIIGRGTAWLDTGTFKGLHDASCFVQTIQDRQGLKIACLETIAQEKGLI